MLDLHRPIPSDPKVYFTHSVLPSYIDPLNVSTKKYPFRAIAAQPSSHALDLLLPSELYALVRDKLASTYYARVHMSLADILSPDFLTTYIKHGNIAMLSEGRPLVDNKFALYDGVLRLELDRQTYEKCGLQGVPIEDGGKKHKKQRWVVRYDLKEASMRHGKRGFGRLEWAAKNVLGQSLTWVWWNANPSSEQDLKDGKEVLSGYAPFVHDVKPVGNNRDGVLVPKLVKGAMEELYDQDASLALLEYLDLVSLGSPRINADDKIDPALSRYEVPDLGAGTITKDMVCVRWKGLLTPAFVRDIFLGVRGAVFKSSGRTTNGDVDVDMGVANVEKEEEMKWFSMSARAFGGNQRWTVMQFEGRETMTWECED